jgi:hypothetical protein
LEYQWREATIAATQDHGLITVPSPIQPVAALNQSRRIFPALKKLLFEAFWFVFAAVEIVSGACYNLLPPLYRKGASLANLTLVGFTAENEVTLQALRTRLQKMLDQELLRFGQAAKYMCSPGANFGGPPRQIFLIQLREVRSEWQRRNPDLPPTPSLGGTEGRANGSKA